MDLKVRYPDKENKRNKSNKDNRYNIVCSEAERWQYCHPQIKNERLLFHRTLPKIQTAIIFDLNVDHNPDRT